MAGVLNQLAGRRAAKTRAPQPASILSHRCARVNPFACKRRLFRLFCPDYDSRRKTCYNECVQHPRSVFKAGCGFANSEMEVLCCMTYGEALDYIHSTLRFGIRPGLERITALLHRLGDPQKGMRFIHVAGTNGKGSTACAIACAAQAAGLRTGLYTSPYIDDFCERMQIDRVNISHEEVASGVERLLGPVHQMAAAEGQPTEFELCTALAFDWFKRRQCDLVVLEVGLGGRFDATNVIDTPLVSVIASISLDHMKILGDTIAKIAFEKCGIIKPGGVTVSTPGQNPDALAVIMEACAQRGNTLVIPNEAGVRVLSEGAGGSEIEYKGQRLTVPLAGRHQIRNFLTAFEALEAARGWGLNVPPEAVRKGFAAVRFPARFEHLASAPDVFVDGAHNPGAAAVLCDTVHRVLAGHRLCIVMGIFADKDYPAVIGAVAPLAARFFAVTPPSPRGLPAADTARLAASHGVDAAACESLDEACRLALAAAGPGGAVLICGSLSLAGPARSLFAARRSMT